MEPRDIRKYANQTNRRLLIGLVLLLLLVGNGLIYLLYGQAAALSGLLCMGALLLPLALIWAYINGLAWLRDRVDPSP